MDLFLLRVIMKTVVAVIAALKNTISSRTIAMVLDELPLFFAVGENGTPWIGGGITGARGGGGS